MAGEVVQQNENNLARGGAELRSRLVDARRAPVIGKLATNQTSTESSTEVARRLSFRSDGSLAASSAETRIFGGHAARRRIGRLWHGRLESLTALNQPDSDQ